MAIASDYSNLWIWLKGSSGFVDQSGNSRTVTLAAGGAAPTVEADTRMDMNALKFAQANSQYCTLPDMSGLTEGEVFIVLKRLSAGDAGFWRLGGSGANDHMTYAGDIYDSFGSSARRQMDLGSMTLTDRYHVYNSRSTAGSWVATLDGSEIFNTSSNTVTFPTVPTLGKSIDWYLNAYVMEFFIYSSLRAAEERSDLIASLLATYEDPPVFISPVTIPVRTAPVFDRGGGITVSVPLGAPAESGGEPAVPLSGQRFPRGK